MRLNHHALCLLASACVIITGSPKALQAAVLATAERINLNGSDIETDSFDSSDMRYSINRRYPIGHPEMTKDYGNLLCASGLVDALHIGDARIRSYARTGAGTNTIYMGVLGSVGDRQWVQSTNGVQPGHASTDLNLVFPAVTMPPNAAWLVLSPASPPGCVVDGTNYQFVINATGHIDYSILSLASGQGGLYITGPSNAIVRVWIRSNVDLRTNDAIRIAPTGVKVRIYVTASSFSLINNACIDNQSGLAENFYLYGLPTCTEIVFGNNASFYGAIYAPSAAFTVGGGSGIPLDLVGASVTRNVTMFGRYRFHFDENLNRVGPCPPEIMGQPEDQLVPVGEDATFSASATGPALAYQWRLGGTNIVGATTSTFTVASPTHANDGDYSVVITNDWGINTSRDARLLSLAPYPPSITQQPLGQTVLRGSAVALQVTASGTQPLSFQWLFNGTNLVGQTGDTLNLPSVQKAHGGAYSVVIGNVAGWATSEVAQLTVLWPPTITRQPQSIAAVPGGMANFSVAVQGQAPFTFQWQANGSPMPGETSAALSIASVQSIHFADYQLLITNADGWVLSDAASLRAAASPALGSVGLNFTTFSFAFPTELGPTYVVEYAYSLENPSWQILTTVAGTGATIPLTDFGVTNAMKFYRVRLQ